MKNNLSYTMLLLVFICVLLVCVGLLMRTVRDARCSVQQGKGGMSIKLLQEYLKIRTAHPNPDYRGAIALFKRCAQEDGFVCTELRLPSGNPVLVITLRGSSSELPALALNHHMDVVPAENEREWKYPPFAAIEHEGMIYGRGAQDCKGLGVVQYMALRHLKQSGMSVARTIHMLLVPDEELGGFCGTKEFVKHPEFKSLKIGYVLDEGMPSGHGREVFLKVDERTPLQIRVTCCGQQGHAAFVHNNCVHTLLACLSGLIAQIGVKPQVSVQVTALTTNGRGHTCNVVPSQAQATLDIRIPSAISINDGLALIESTVHAYPRCSYALLATSYERCTPVSQNSEFYQLLAQAAQAHGFTPKPYVFEATTDARFYSHQGIEAIGFTPFCVVPNLHGTNEAVRVQDLMDGSAVLVTFLELFCSGNTWAR